MSNIPDKAELEQQSVDLNLQNANKHSMDSNLNKKQKKDGKNKDKKTKCSNTKEQGKFVELPGAEMGKVVVRFPPEASGYLHIGHAKAALLNQHYQLAFNGRLVMRFDDTNPAKEKEDFEKVILEDVDMLKIKPDAFTYTSDYFDTMLVMCENLLKAGHAFVDDTDGEKMRLEREQRIESINRNNSIEKNLELWNQMIMGSAIGQTCCVRAKIDMASVNGCMRDPTVYRCKPEIHPRTSDKYKVYPTYDFACPIVDSLEGITHCLRTTEYTDRDQQYYWFCDTLKLGQRDNETRPFVWSYSRLNMTNTVLSKRKLTWFVEQGLVDGWEDPRMPTVRGVFRRGMQLEALKQFIISQGSSRTVTAMQWDKIWSLNRSIIDPVAPRHTALLRANLMDEKIFCHNPVEVFIENVKKPYKLNNVPKHPKNTQLGFKDCVWGAPNILIDYSDAELLEVGRRATFINWGNLLINKIDRNPDSNYIEKVYALTDLENVDFKSTVKITWLPNIKSLDSNEISPSLIPVVCVYFEHLISKPVLAKDDDFKQFITKNSRWELQMWGDFELKDLKKSEIIQLQRRGFFICDSPYQSSSICTGTDTPLVLFHIPDGHTKLGMPIGGVNTISTTNTIKADNVQGHKTLLGLKGELKDVKFPPDGIPTSKSTSQSVDEIITKINEQGNNVRTMKSNGASKVAIGEAVKILLALKGEYKSITGVDFPPGGIPTPKSSDQSNSKPTSQSVDEIITKINEQGNNVRTMKSNGASKVDIGEAVKTLLALKGEYKSITGVDFPPGGIPTPKSSNQSNSKPTSQSVDEITKINEQENNVSIIKSNNTSKVKKHKKKENVAVNTTKTSDCSQIKKVTKLGLEVQKVAEYLGDWYSQVLVKSEMIEYYDVSGCYILRPWSYKIWSVLQEWFDARIKSDPLNVENCYFPIFVSRGALEKEKEHIADFAPEVAWVTKSGETDLAEPIAIRPTSETVMYPAFAKWIQSYRDLPLKLNQWNNVVRWEFKHPQPFLRTREFLWQEGHHAYATQEEAERDVLIILDYYEYVYTNMLAVPVIKGRKTEKEKFAGGVFTATCEVYVSASGRAIQGATSHYLGTNFARMFDVQYEHPITHEQLFVHQISYGMTTRTIGVMVMVHGDDRGLVLPPNVASIQVIIVLCGVGVNTSEDVKQNLIRTCQEVCNRLKGDSISKENEDKVFHNLQKPPSILIRAHTDLRDNYSPGWKFNHWELKGVPLRLEIGPKDLDRGQITAVRRDTGEKLTIPLDIHDRNKQNIQDPLVDRIKKLLNQIQQDMLAKAKQEMKNNVIICRKWSNCATHLAKKCLLLVPFCGQPACEDNIKRDTAKDDGTAEIGASTMGAKSLCVPFEQPDGDDKLKPDDKCIHPECGQPAGFFTLFGRSY